MSDEARKTEQPEAEASPATSFARRSSSTALGETNGGLGRIREILLGDILVEIEQQLARLDSYVANRSNEVQHDARHRADLLEAHLRREIDGVTSRVTHDTTELTAMIRELRHHQRETVSQVEQRLARIEDRLEAAVARLEREGREQLLTQAKSFLEELESTRNQLRSALARERSASAEPPYEEGGEHGAWASPH